ncbi:helix-turn-helix domain-containing protein [Amycolatopsis acidicola]|uniref:Helix-turn-helix domain-containing protein n=1 Tax=Amycolatopsis acidicola TaxID=2596893 RepID=A0A5N0VLV2_9PSEU|nr:helix-turn-helix transcriptional regulator [Amycolatopsis acidicola]KAA9165591.1 helix-turn-helix domain-containing protein [Amycolatopsis acidicola]
MADMVQRKELAAFLRSRREATDPVSLGLTPGPRRRTPGLRREELAQLSGVSLTWYTWLEQARDISVSRQVIDSLARTLRMPPPERTYLFTLAGLALPAEDPGRPHVDGMLRRLVGTLQPNPAYVINPWWDILCHNEAYGALLGGLDHRPAAERNGLWLLFTDPDVAALFPDWQSEARQLVGQLRANLARYPKDPRGPEVVEALRQAGPKFGELWEDHDVRRFRAARKRFRHPVAGRLDLDYVKLAAADDDQQQLVVFLPSGEQDIEKLGLLR